MPSDSMVTDQRSRFEVEGTRRSVTLRRSTSAGMQLVGMLHRTGHSIGIAHRSGFGLTIHRDGGLSLSRIPRSGGTSILWGAANERMRTLGRDHRAFHFPFGSVGVYVGSDF